MGKVICPKCKSMNVRKELNVLLVGGAPQKWVCKDCGFYSYLFPEIESNKKIKKKTNGKEKNK